MAKESLNIVNDNDEVIGEELRADIHSQGLLHREIHVWFYTPQGEVIFQHRAKDKDTYPDLLDSTVGGHVEIGDSYEQTALKETLEETGLLIKASDLKFLKQIKMRSVDPVTNTINYALKNEYAYLFDDDVNNLKIEQGKAVGFEAWPIEKLLQPTEADREKFIPIIFSPEFREIFILIKNL